LVTRCEERAMLYERKRFHREYLSIMDPFDEQWHYERYEANLWVKHQIAHHVAPNVLVEIGVRNGYTAWAMSRAVPDARYIGYDNYAPEYKEGGQCVSEHFKLWAHLLLRPPRFEIVEQDSQAPGFRPAEAQLYHVDGDHSTAGALNDIRNCVSAGARGAIIVVHDYKWKPVRDAVDEAVEKMGFGVASVNTHNGDAIMFKGEEPSWVRGLEAK
jgi:predicted O-methyltransferase YrrM